MKKFGLATITASGVIAVLVGMGAGIAQAAAGPGGSTTVSADIDHHQWIAAAQPAVDVPRIDTTLRANGRG